jgi:hypothetical protein
LSKVANSTATFKAPRSDLLAVLGELRLEVRLDVLRVALHLTASTKARTPGEPGQLQRALLGNNTTQERSDLIDVPLGLFVHRSGALATGAFLLLL